MKWKRAVALGAFLCVPLSGFGSALPQAGDSPETKSHGFAERRVAFEDAWSQASKEDRDRLRAEVRRYRNVGLPALRQVNSARLVRWTRVLNGHEVSELPTALEDWMGNVEVRLLPGWMVEQHATEGPQILAHVLAPSQPPGLPASDKPARIQLDWVNAKGERKLARATTVAPADFGARGFELFLNYPSESGTGWRLEPSLVLADTTLWGHPAGFFTPSVWVTGLEGHPSSFAVMRLQKSGFRDMRWGGLSFLFENKPSFKVSDPRGGSQMTLTRHAHPNPKKPVRALVWVVVPGSQLLDSEFIGERGRSWNALAANGVTIIASHAPLQGSKDAQDSASSTMIRETKELTGVPKILVVRGNLARGLGIGSKKAFEGFDALVLQNPRNNNAAPRVPFGEAPTLFLFPSDPWKAPTVPASQRAVANMDPPAVMSMDTARYIGQYLDFLAPKAGETTASGAEER